MLSKKSTLIDLSAYYEMKILFVYTNINVRAANFGKNPAVQIGIASISALLKQKGHQTDLLLLTSLDDTNLIAEKISTFNPDIVAFTSVTTQFTYTEIVSQYIRKAYPDIFQICGGPHATLAQEDAITSSVFDAICIGEGEFPMLELVEKLEKGQIYSDIKNLYIKTDQNLIKNEIRPFCQDLDLLPFIDRDIYSSYVMLDEYPHSVLTTRGCYFNCSYCCNHAFKKIAAGKYVRSRSVNNVMREIEMLQSRYPKMKYLYIEDETIGQDQEFWNNLLPMLKTTKLKFGSNYRIGVTPLSFIERLRDANFIKVNVGIESGNEFIREKILNRRYSNQQIIKTFAYLKKLGIKTKSYNLIGLPHETPEKFEDTININKYIQPEETMLNIFYPYPGTKLDKLCDKLKLKSGEVSKKIRERTESVLNLPEFPQEKLMYYFDNWRKLIRGSIPQRIKRAIKNRRIKI